MPAGTSQPAPQQPHLVWKRLAPLIAAPGRSQLRLYNPDTGKFTDTARRNDTLPRRPAAVYLYSKGRTQLLVLDFDAKHPATSGADVDADLAAAASWITQCGGVVVTDRSTSRGGHLLCPLAIGTSASRDEIVAIVRLFAARLSTLDITPNTGATHGCITPPGSPCREGGFRQLDGPLQAAVEAFTTRSAPDLLPRLNTLLGGLRSTPPRQSPPRPDDIHSYTTGAGADERLAPAYVRDEPLPPVVNDFATHGHLSPSRPAWRSRSEARMAVITQAIARGHTLNSIRAMIAPGRPWRNGLGCAYQHYRHHADTALTRDHTKALTWLITNVIISLPPQHKTKYSQGGQPGAQGPADLRRWLANAYTWADREFAGQRYRWTVHVVLQAIGWHALINGERIKGTWVVGVGGRTISLGTGLLSEDTVWRVLRDLRDRPGAPLIRIRQAIGVEADVYALTTHNIVQSERIRAEIVTVAPIHDAWFVIGHHLRRVYELIAYYGLTKKSDIYAAAGIPRSTGDTMILDLEVIGLIRRSGRGTVGTGSRTLDAIAGGHQLDQQRQDRIERYRRERAQWRTWLNQQHGAAATDDDCWAQTIAAQNEVAAGSAAGEEHEAWLKSVMATGPPPVDENQDEHQLESAAIEIVAELLGAKIVAAS